MRRVVVALLFFLLSLPSFAAKETPFQTLDWPETGTPTLRFTFSKLKAMQGGVGKEHGYVTDVTAENLSEKSLSSAGFLLYAFDKAHARIGDGTVTLSNVEPHQTVKFEITLYATGVPASLSLAPRAARSSSISITVNSVPQGAFAKLDGKDLGTTPKIAEVSVGKHMLEFSRDGYNTGRFPLEVGPRDASGGSVSYELGKSGHDTLELRDGSVLTGDVISIDANQVQVRIGGTVQTYDRNQIKRVSFTQRDAPTP